ncbi:MAG TPA: hypothetical protein VIC26_10445 [Marinagarivorans sp.]
MHKKFILAGVIPVLFACSPEPKPTGVIPQSQLDALEKAKDVENLMKNTEKDRKKLLDE